MHRTDFKLDNQQYVLEGIFVKSEEKTLASLKLQRLESNSSHERKIEILVKEKDHHVLLGLLSSRAMIIEDVQSEIFKQLLFYIYAGRIEKPPSERTAQSLYLARADKYNIKNLEEDCYDHLSSCIQLGNVFDLLIWTHLNSVIEMEKSVLQFIDKHGKEICQLIPLR